MVRTINWPTSDWRDVRLILSSGGPICGTDEPAKGQNRHLTFVWLFMHRVTEVWFSWVEDRKLTYPTDGCFASILIIIQYKSNWIQTYPVFWKCVLPNINIEMIMWEDHLSQLKIRVKNGHFKLAQLSTPLLWKYVTFEVQCIKKVIDAFDKQYWAVITSQFRGQNA